MIWVVFAVNFFGTLARRRERHLYVALWFYIATIVAIAVLHIFNNLVVVAGPLKSYSIYAGVQDAFMQWWYGHNAVAFFLTTPFLGMMYYFLPKAAERPVFSYRLSILHFWTLVFIYIWAGPHHLHYTALPAWASTLGMLFSVMLWMPSWGGMINGLLTLRGAWHKVTEDPVLKFFVVAITFYGMSTFEGPLLSIKSVNALSHYTDWTIAHVHAGALGWVGFMVFGMIYWLLPRLFQTELWSKKLAELHFWIATIGILLYIVAIYAAGLTQGLMLRAFDESGRLAYPDFIETTVRLIPMYWVRVLGGGLYIAGMVLCGVNVLMTWRRLPPSTQSPCTRRRRSRRRLSHGGGGRRIHARGLAPALGRHAADVLHLGGGGGGERLALRDRAHVPHPLERAHHRRGQAVHAARAARTRRLHRRGLQQLPLADDPAHPLGDGALRRIQQARRVRLRPSVPVGLAPHRAGPAAHRRQVPEPLARAPHGRPALDHAAIDHAPVPVAGEATHRLPARSSAAWRRR